MRQPGELGELGEGEQRQQRLFIVLLDLGGRGHFAHTLGGLYSALHAGRAENSSNRPAKEAG